MCSLYILLITLMTRRFAGSLRQSQANTLSIRTIIKQTPIFKHQAGAPAYAGAGLIAKVSSPHHPQYVDSSMKPRAKASDSEKG